MGGTAAYQEKHPSREFGPGSERLLRRDIPLVLGLSSLLCMAVYLACHVEEISFFAGFAVGIIPTAFLLFLMYGRLRQQSAAYDKFVQEVIDIIPVPIYIKDSGCRYRWANRALAEDLQIPQEMLAQRTTAEVARDKEDGARSENEDRRVLAGSLKVHLERHDVHPLTGQERHRVIMKGFCRDVAGEAMVVGANFDITRWWTGEQDLLRAKLRLQALLEAETAQRQRTEAFIQRLIDVIPDPVFIKKAGGQYVMINDAFAQYRKVDKFDFRQFRVPSRLSCEEDERVLAGEEITKEDHTVRQATGEEIFRIVSKRRSIFVDGEPVVVGVEHHITRWRVAERELRRLAQEDELTGLANRRHFSREAERLIDRAHRYDEKLSLLMLDVDLFKQINDSYGHNIGDEVLCEMARRLQICLRKSDLPGRWGGEEFVVLLPNTALEVAWNVAERMRQDFAGQAVTTPAGPIRVSFSGGCARLQAGDSLYTLLARADAALYRAKDLGRNRIECAGTEAVQEIAEKP
jgi:diguanylate cyclase (GGDEF)-like protein